MPDNYNVVARIIAVEILDVRMVQQIIFSLSFKRSFDIYSGVAKEIFSPADCHAMIERQTFQEVKNFVRQKRIFYGGVFYSQDNPAVESVKKIPAQVKKFVQIGIVDIAAQEDDILPFIVFNEPLQSFDILFA